MLISLSSSVAQSQQSLSLSIAAHWIDHTMSQSQKWIRPLCCCSAPPGHCPRPCQHVTAALPTTSSPEQENFCFQNIEVTRMNSPVVLGHGLVLGLLQAAGQTGKY